MMQHDTPASFAVMNTFDDRINKSILLVEDTSALRNEMTQLLETAGYRIVATRNGLEAINILRLIVPDLLITDLLMPGLDGFELVRFVRAHEEISHLRVIIITAKAGDDIDRIAAELGIDRVIRKPCRAMELMTCIEQLLK